MIPVGEWLPDLPEFGNKGTSTVLNVVPAETSYRSFPSLATYSNALTARCQGTFSVKDSATNVYNFAGDATKLYQESSATFYIDSSRLAGGAYTIATDDFWEFTAWGNTVIGVNGADVAQELTLGAANFIALAGTPPIAKHVAVVRDFVVMGNVSSFPQRVQWSGTNNSQTWATSASTLADAQDLAGDGGAVQKVVGGEYGTIFQERSIWRMSFVGSPVVFQFDQVEKNRGALSPQSVVGYGNFTFYLADEGFLVFNGSTSTPIGDKKINRTFFNDLDPGYAYRVNAVVDPVNQLYIVAYPGAGNVGGNPNKLLIYHWGYEKWAPVEVTTEILAKRVSRGYTLDGLDSYSTNLDAIPISLDSRFWTGGLVSLGAFNSSHKMNSFTGTAMNATVDTTEAEISKGNRTQVNGIRPLVQNNTPMVSLGTRNLLTETVTYGGAVSPDTTGVCSFRSNARYHRARIQTTGSFDHIIGIDVVGSTKEGDR